MGHPFRRLDPSFVAFPMAASRKPAASQKPAALRELTFLAKDSPDAGDLRWLIASLFQQKASGRQEGEAADYVARRTIRALIAA